MQQKKSRSSHIGPAAPGRLQLQVFVLRGSDGAAPQNDEFPERGRAKDSRGPHLSPHSARYAREAHPVGERQLLRHALPELKRQVCPFVHHRRARS